MTADLTLQNHFKSDPNFAGIFLYNQLPKLDYRNLIGKYIIINIITQHEVNQGLTGHFVVLDDRFRMKGENGFKGLYYWDPFGTYGKKTFDPDYPRQILGLPTPTKNIINLINSFEKDNFEAHSTPLYEYNKTQFQLYGLGDEVCGVFATVYIEQPNFKLNRWLSHSYDRESLLNLNKLLTLYGYKHHLLKPNPKTEAFLATGNPTA